MGSKAVLLVDDVRLDTEEDRLVILRHLMMDLETESEIYWLVEDMLTGEKYELPPENIGDDTFNEMEALAWASR